MAESSNVESFGGLLDLSDRPDFGGDRTPGNYAYIRTSDRVLYKRCKQKWDWAWSARGNRTAALKSNPLWFGSGFHFAMEDFHGAKRWPTAADAFEAYARAIRKVEQTPADYAELLELGRGMSDYYEEWLKSREPLQTFRDPRTGEYCVELRFQILLDLDRDWLAARGLDGVYYTGTLDRVIVDDYGRLWILDYKTAKTIQTGHLDTDPQITAYCWALSQVFPDYHIAGFVYQQHRKLLPHEPAFLKSTRMFSCNKAQVTTRALYRKALVNLYGELDRAPLANRQFLQWLGENESEKADMLVNRQFVERSESRIEYEYDLIHMEAYDMLNPDQYIYPNFTRDCSWDCDFRLPCQHKCDGGDWEFELQESTVDRQMSGEPESWRPHLELPEPQVRNLQAVRRRRPGR